MAVMDDEDDASETDSCDRKENELRDKLLSLDMLSFVTGTTRSLQLVYICPPIPNDIRQAEVEHLFSLVGFGKDFKLNSIQNSILLEADLHIAWDAYAAFAILPPRDYLTSLANALIACNAAWIAAYDKGSVERVGSADPSLALAVVRRPSHWRLIVLRPALLFSLSQPLMLLSQDARKVVASGGIPTASDWQSWYPHPQNPFLVPCASMETNRELELPDIRDEKHAPSIFGMILNAHTKLRFYNAHRGKGTTYSALRSQNNDFDTASDYLIESYRMDVDRVVDALFFRPRGYDYGLPSADDTAPGDGTYSSAAHDDDNSSMSEGEDSTPTSLEPALPDHESTSHVGLAPLDDPRPISSPPHDHDAACPLIPRSVSDELASADDRTVVESDPTHNLRQGEYSSTQGLEQYAELPFSDPSEPAPPPEEEIDGLTQSEWSTLMKRLNDSDPKVASRAFEMMAFRTNFLVADGLAGSN